MSRVFYRLGMGPPYAVPVTVLATDAFDPTAVTAATIEVTKPNGDRATWAASVLEQSADRFRAAHTLSTGELDQLGAWRVWARLTVAGGELRTEVGHFTVLADDQPV